MHLLYLLIVKMHSIYTWSRVIYNEVNIFSYLLKLYILVIPTMNICIGRLMYDGLISSPDLTRNLVLIVISLEFRISIIFTFSAMILWVSHA